MTAWIQKTTFCFMRTLVKLGAYANARREKLHKKAIKMCYIGIVKKYMRAAERSAALFFYH